MMQYMSIGKAKSRLASLRKQMKQEQANKNQCGIDRQHIIYLDQQIDAFERTIREFESQVKQQRRKK